MTALARVQKNPWWIVFASVFGLLGSGVITIYAFGVFVKPLTEEFGWSRGGISAALSAFSFASALASPFVGSAVDRFGARAVILPGIVLFCLATAALAILPLTLPLFIAMYALIGIIGSAISPLPYVKIITGWFDDKRGLALGIGIMGQGLASMIPPLLAQFLVGNYGWHAGYIGLAVAAFVVTFPPVVALVWENPDVKRKGAVGQSAAPGLALGQALKTSRFWILAVLLFCCMAPAQGVIPHAVALLTDRGIPVGTAVYAASSVGVMTILTGLVVGVCVDRFFAPYVGVAFLSVSLAGLVLLAWGGSDAGSIAGVVLCGVAIGAEIDLVGFLVGRYFGLKDFGKIYGCLFPVLPIGVAVGAWLMGATFDRFHSYQPMLIAFSVSLCVSIFLLFRLGPYTYPAADR